LGVKARSRSGIRAKVIVSSCIFVLLWVLPLRAQRFYPDDPLTEEPAPFPVEEANFRELNPLYELITHRFWRHGTPHTAEGVIPSQSTNTLGEVMDGLWFVNRHARRRLTAKELLEGSTLGEPPSRQEKWRVLTVRKYGIRPGLLIHDAKNQLYLLRFDPKGRLEMSTGAEMIGSRIFHALGYWVAEHHLVYFDRAQLVADPEGEDINAVDKVTRLEEEDIDLFLEKVPRDPVKGYRAVAISPPKPSIKLLGPFQFYGTRSDDPNDVVPHERRRELRGLYAISAWLANNWINAIQTMDILVQKEGLRYIRHEWAGFGTMLGSGFEEVKQAHDGYESLFDLRSTFKNFAGMGIYSPEWQRAHYPGIRSVGLFESTVFDPAKWRPMAGVPALTNHLPDDDYWAAKQILAFTDDDLKVMVKAAQYSDQRAEEWVAKCLIERRDKVVRYFLDRVLPLENFRIEDGVLHFDDVAAQPGLRASQNYAVEWSEFRNLQNGHVALLKENSFQVPEHAASAEVGSYLAAKISANVPGKTLTVYLRKEASGFKTVGIERDWPGKVLAKDQRRESKPGKTYADLTPRQKELIDSYVADYNRKTGFKLTPEAGYAGLSSSERTTFDAITHALSKSELTDRDNKSLGTALDLVVGVERIAGQYYGRQGDEEFRLYCKLKPDAREILEKCREFKFEEENTVYHVGYPHSHRQVGSAPTLQFSMSEDGLRADIDVDYRSSKLPAAMWNGHLSAANSDVRAGNNYERHNHRWAGLINWWSALFGNLREQGKQEDEMLAKEPPEPATPLPPNRPPGAQIAEVWEATQEMLTDWLVRRNGEAQEFVSDQALACARLEDGTDPRTLTAAEARRRLQEIMKVVSDKAGHVDNLTQTIEAVIPWRKAFRVVKQPFAGDFTIVEAPDGFAEYFRCESRSREKQLQALSEETPRYGTYYGAVFRFKSAAIRGGVLALLWTKQSGVWRIIAWEVLSS
jgi:hypothetical protein